MISTALIASTKWIIFIIENNQVCQAGFTFGNCFQTFDSPLCTQKCVRKVFLPFFPQEANRQKKIKDFSSNTWNAVQRALENIVEKTQTFKDYSSLNFTTTLIIRNRRVVRPQLLYAWHRNWWTLLGFNEQSEKFNFKLLYIQRRSMCLRKGTVESYQP